MADRESTLANSDAWTAEADRYKQSVAQYTSQAGQAVVQAVQARRALSPTTSRVLDVGAGTGAATEAILKAAPGVSVTATDIAGGMLKQIDALGLSNVKTLEADALELAGSLQAANLAGPYSHVFSTFMLQFVPDPDRVLQHVFAVTEPGAVVGLNMWHGNSFYHDFFIASLQAGNTSPSWSPPGNPFAEGSWEEKEEQDEALRRAGFVDVQSHDFDVYSDMTEGLEGEAGVDNVIRLIWELENPTKIKAMHGWEGDAEQAKEYGRAVLRRDYGSGKKCRMSASMSTARKP